MEFHQWQQQLREALKTQRVPRSYGKRLLHEMELHFQELQEAQHMSDETDRNELVEQLGDPATIAAQSATLPYPTWTGRHPLLGFIVGAPAMVLGLTLVVALAVAFTLLPLASGKTLQTDPWLGPVMTALGPAQVMLPALIASLLICRSADRSGRSAWWGICGCGLIAVFCAATVIQWLPAATTPGTGNLSLGMSFPFGAAWYQALVPLLVGLLYGVLRLRPTKPTEDKEATEPLRAAA